MGKKCRGESDRGGIIGGGLLKRNDGNLKAKSVGNLGGEKKVRGN